MAKLDDGCPIWGRDYSATGERRPTLGMVFVNHSSRASGAYKVLRDLDDLLARLAMVHKAKLTTELIEERRRGNESPEVTREMVDRVKGKDPLPVHVRANRLLEFLADRSTPIGSKISTPEDPADEITAGLLAWSESTEWAEVHYLLEYLENEGWIDGVRQSDLWIGCIVTVPGHRQVYELKTNSGSSG